MVPSDWSIIMHMYMHYIIIYKVYVTHVNLHAYSVRYMSHVIIQLYDEHIRAHLL